MSNRRKPRKPRKHPSAPHASIKSGVYVLNIQHDDGCPTIRTQRMGDCSCPTVNSAVHDAHTYFRDLKEGGTR